MKKATEFVLTRNNEEIGHISWVHAKKNWFGLQKDGYLEGDAQAVKLLTDTFEQAVREHWMDIVPPPTGRGYVSDPLNHDTEFLSVLARAGFEIPQDWQELWENYTSPTPVYSDGTVFCD